MMQTSPASGSRGGTAGCRRMRRRSRCRCRHLACASRAIARITIDVVEPRVVKSNGKARGAMKPDSITQTYKKEARTPILRQQHAKATIPSIFKSDHGNQARGGLIDAWIANGGSATAATPQITSSAKAPLATAPMSATLKTVFCSSLHSSKFAVMLQCAT